MCVLQKAVARGGPTGNQIIPSFALTQVGVDIKKKKNNEDLLSSQYFDSRVWCSWWVDRNVLPCIPMVATRRNWHQIQDNKDK
jgi:hypothetical protein